MLIKLYELILSRGYNEVDAKAVFKQCVAVQITLNQYDEYDATPEQLLECVDFINEMEGMV